MKNIWQIITLVMAIALIALTIKVERTEKSASNMQTTESIDKIKQEAALENIMTRSSVRTYTSQTVDNEKIEIMLKAGMAAPTARNRQPWQFIVITERELLDALPSSIGQRAPLAIAVCGESTQITAADPIDYMWIQDCSAATENILLAAHSLGLGAVWTGCYPENESGRVAKMKKMFGLPSDVYPLSVIMIGYPDSEPVVKDKWKPEKVHYNRY